MTDFALTKFLRMRSCKLMIHFDPNIRGEYQNLAGRLTETGFQRKVDAAVRTISTRIDAIKASKALEGLSWEPPTYSFVRCGLDAAGLKCLMPGIRGSFDSNQGTPSVPTELASGEHALLHSQDYFGGLNAAWIG
jgi:hypothetical protein